MTKTLFEHIERSILDQKEALDLQQEQGLWEQDEAGYTTLSRSAENGLDALELVQTLMQEVREALFDLLSKDNSIHSLNARALLIQLDKQLPKEPA